MYPGRAIVSSARKSWSRAGWKKLPASLSTLESHSVRVASPCDQVAALTGNILYGIFAAADRPTTAVPYPNGSSIPNSPCEKFAGGTSMKKNVCLALICVCTAVLAVGQETKQPTPAEGYTVHVTAPHVVNAKVMGPFHHYCKVHSPDPVIVCLIYDSAEPNARLSQVEYIIAKKITRANVSLKEWNRKWHDHRLEIATG